MARYRGPKDRIARTFGEPVFGDTNVLQKKAYSPGQHGRMRRKKSVYAQQLMAKQKAKYIYGVLERQFSNLFDKAARRKGVTGELLLQMLESRLDNAVYRMGFAKTRRAARQLVSHKHIVVNERVVNIPSYAVKPGDIVSVREKSRGLAAVQEALGAGYRSVCSWLEVDTAQYRGKLMALPTREDIPEKIDDKRIVELYSK